MVFLPVQILNGIILIAAPILLSYHLYPSSKNYTNTADDFQITELPISKILAQNLLIANSTRECGILTQALLELQNPELTVFAGAGYGVHLRHPNPGAIIEAFPNGELPQAGGSRYDPWTMVKGLRYAAGLIVTDGSAGPVIEDDEVKDKSAIGRIRKKSTGTSGESKKLRNGGWLFFQEGDRSAVEAAGLGWAALLLERAGAVDIQNPVGKGRNAYAEAVDGMLDWLYDESRNSRCVLKDSDNAVNVEDSETRADQAQMRQVEQGQWAISYMYDLPQLRPETIFLVAPFLAAYAVARQDNYWLLEAVEQVRIHEKILAKGKGLWRPVAIDLGQSDMSLLDDPNCFTGSAWALAGMVRLLTVLERRQHGSSAEMSTKLSVARKELLTFVEDILHQAQSFARDDHTDLLEGQLVGDHKENSSGCDVCMSSGDAIGTASIVSSVYRLAQVGLLENIEALIWADEFYNAVAAWVDVSIGSGPVSTTAGDHLNPGAERSELYSVMLMMYAARRDCAELRICRLSQPKRWNIWSPLTFT